MALGTVTFHTCADVAGSNYFIEQGERAKVYVLLKLFIMLKETLLLSDLCLRAENEQNEKVNLKTVDDKTTTLANLRWWPQSSWS